MQDYAKTLSSVPGIQAPSSPFGDFPELRAYTQSSFQLPVSNAVSQAIGARADTSISNDATARKNRIEEINNQIQQVKDYQDKNKWQKVLKEDGGYDFYDPFGNKVSIGQYSQATGQQPYKILADSQNSLDRQYLADQNNTVKVLSFVRSGDINGLKKFLDKNPGIGSDYIKKNFSTPGFYNTLIEQLHSAYPNIYQADNVNASPTGQVRQGTDLFGSGQDQNPNLVSQLSKRLQQNRVINNPVTRFINNKLIQ